MFQPIPSLSRDSRSLKNLAGLWLLAALCVVLLSAVRVEAARGQRSGAPNPSSIPAQPGGREAAQDITPQDITPSINPLSSRQRQELLKSNFEKMKQDAGALATLAKSLQQDVDKSNQNVLSLKIVEEAEKIEKLARKIKTAAKSY